MNALLTDVRRLGTYTISDGTLTTVDEGATVIFALSADGATLTRDVDASVWTRVVP